jgi:hypothetical protein
VDDYGDDYGGPSVALRAMEGRLIGEILLVIRNRQRQQFPDLAILPVLLLHSYIYPPVSGDDDRGGD